MSQYLARAYRRRAFLAALGAAILAAMSSPPAWAQSQEISKPSRIEPAIDPSRTARIGIANVGQRQVAPVIDPDLPNPYGRIESRVLNRVQNRLSNRIDPNYRASTGFADPFRAATREGEIGKGKKPR